MLARRYVGVCLRAVFPAHFKLSHYLPLGNPEIRDGFS
jgi:hypothetical protein